MTKDTLQPASLTAPDGGRLPPDTLVTLAWIARDSGMSEKWFYKLIARGAFMSPIKFGRSSRWRVGDYYGWIDHQRQQAADLQQQRRQTYLKKTTSRRAGSSS